MAKLPELKITIYDDWDIINEKWEYVNYMLVEMNNKLYLFEKNLNKEDSDEL
jgi:hypothetical protein